MDWDVIVIGGGASGLMAAGRAAELGARVLLLEKMGRIGMKLTLTGKGRCNLTNSGDLDTFLEHYRHNGKFLHNAFSRFFNDDLVAFLQNRGLPTVVERGNRIFPASQRAQDVLNVLRDYASSHGARLQVHSPAREILRDGNQVVGVQAKGTVFPASRVILATGGASYPQTGSTGDGYIMAEKMGHTIIPIRPALIPLVVEEPSLAGLQGLTLRNVRASLLADGRKIGREFGEMIITHFGVSGPIILALSGLAVEEIGRRKTELAIDFKPALSRDQLDARMVRELQAHGRKRIENILSHLLPKKLIPLWMERADISPGLKGSDIRADARKKLVQWLKDFRLLLKGSRPLEEAVVTAGGIAVKEIQPATMESKIIRGLYFCGEIIDLDGKTGGYNLQAAFSTGWVAGGAAATNSDGTERTRES